MPKHTNTKVSPTEEPNADIGSSLIDALKLKGRLDKVTLLSTEDAATYVNASVEDLEILRAVGKGPDIYVCGDQVFYRKPDLHAWLYDLQAAVEGLS